MTAVTGSRYPMGIVLEQVSVPHVHHVREQRRAYPVYEAEGSEERTLGTVGVSAGARWIASLTVSIPDGQVAFIELERRGDLPFGYRGSEESAAFSVPIAETDAIFVLLKGLLDHGRADGVLPGPVRAFDEA